jgi:hypothetical protein
MLGGVHDVHTICKGQELSYVKGFGSTETESWWTPISCHPVAVPQCLIIVSVVNTEFFLTFIILKGIMTSTIEYRKFTELCSVLFQIASLFPKERTRVSARLPSRQNEHCLRVFWRALASLRQARCSGALFHSNMPLIIGKLLRTVGLSGFRRRGKLHQF